MYVSKEKTPFFFSLHLRIFHAFNWPRPMYIFGCYHFSYFYYQPLPPPIWLAFLKMCSSLSITMQLYVTFTCDRIENEHWQIKGGEKEMKPYKMCIFIQVICLSWGFSYNYWKKHIFKGVFRYFFKTFFVVVNFIKTSIHIFRRAEKVPTFFFCCFQFHLFAIFFFSFTYLMMAFFGLNFITFGWVINGNIISRLLEIASMYQRKLYMQIYILFD